MATPKKMPHERKPLGIAPRIPYTPDLGDKVFERMAGGRHAAELENPADRQLFKTWNAVQPVALPQGQVRARLRTELACA